MDLILWRHAEAKDALEGEDDLQRKLTGKGERQAERMAQWLNRRLAPSTRILVSPALRCRQTAAPLGRDVETVAALGPDTSVQAVLDAARWPSASEPVLIVGHQPTLGLVAARVLAGVEQAWSMKKGAVWWLRAREAEGGVALLAVIGPEWV
jgi:phosphohistidine phosphatase